MGCSQGGFVSALFAAAHPEVVVSRLILFYPALCIPEDARGKMLMYAFDPSNIPEQIFPVIPEGCSDPIEPLGRAYVASVQKIDAFAAIALYPGPVLIVHGDSDTAVNVINSRRAQAAYHSVKPLRCQLAEISGANHGFMGNEAVHYGIGTGIHSGRHQCTQRRCGFDRFHQGGARRRNRSDDPLWRCDPDTFLFWYDPARCCGYTALEGTGDRSSVR